MEKKTIGAFISALRRAHGMTQRELGDRLFVSDKTVSRWERDECTPDLSLIPAIADIFGVTADELLRGERKTAAPIPTDSTEPNGDTPKKDARSERQFKILLDRRMTKYKNLSLIAAAIGLLGIIVAAIINLGFLRAYIAFGVALVFLLGATICQICFLMTARMRQDDADEESEPDSHTAAIAIFNTQTVRIAQNVFWVLLELLAFCLPLAMVGDAYYGLNFGSWLFSGLACAAVALILLHSVYELGIRRLLIDKQLLPDTPTYPVERKLLGRALVVFVAVGLLVPIATTFVQSWSPTAFVKPYVFETKEEFIDFMAIRDSRDEYYSWDEDGNIFVNVDTLPIEPEDTLLDGENNNESIDEDFTYDDPLREYIYDLDGNELFSYINRRQSARIELSDTPDRLPIRVHTQNQIRQGYAIRDGICTAIIVAYGIFGAVCVAVYVRKLYLLRKEI